MPVHKKVAKAAKRAARTLGRQALRSVKARPLVRAGRFALRAVKAADAAGARATGHGRGKTLPSRFFGLKTRPKKRKREPLRKAKRTSAPKAEFFGLRSRTARMTRKEFGEGGRGSRR